MSAREEELSADVTAIADRSASSFAKRLEARISRTARALRDSQVMKSLVGVVSTKEAAWWLAIITLLGPGSVTSIAADSPRGCDPGASAAAYDRKADEYEAAADERYSAWAKAHVATEQDGSARDLAEDVARLGAAAEESRARAAESRSREHSTVSVDGCAPERAARAQD